MMTPEVHSRIIRELAAKHGFAFAGLSKAEKLEEEARRLEQWLKQGSHGKMHYMENHFDKRVDPTLLVPGAKSVISLMYNYYPKEEPATDNKLKIARYAYGEDYHYVIKDILRAMVADLQQQIGDFHARIFVDSAPVLEKAWARKSGIGWQGKNTNLIHPKAGSFYFLAEIICDIEVMADGPIKDHCGTCTACLDACPTEALYEPYKIDASRCISYLTIELKDEIIPGEFHDKMEGWMFGCDICQEVCPWNRFSKPHRQPRFHPDESVMHMDRNDWMEMTDEVMLALIKNSPLSRPGPAGIRRNLL